ncbi:kinase-like protein [Periconia macrospinosa]|uniref:Kinase-like protein n=1 Tax=Periconia macrospinosa TaxID=97972 RepID=A0A2V1D946_9PLEO|nr:kinase-like protein [Periconia macrospinosa]
MSAASSLEHNPQHSSLLESTPSPCVSVNGVVLDWSGLGTSHVDFSKADNPPLQQGRFLGYGVHGGVYETSYKGIALAWKRKFCRHRIYRKERQEIEIIKRLDHRHVIKLVGTYTHGPFLGLLLWPVATCDLASLMEDVDWLQKEVNGELVKSPSVVDSTEQQNERDARLEALGISLLSYSTATEMAIAYLEKSLGCIASAIAYLHRSGIKHKDLKPSNILLSHNGLWVTDFGSATDFSVLTQSVTDNGERGTPKYFAPEVAAFRPSGRSADIFSLGCIFLEIITLCVGYTLQETQRLRENNDRSFHSNLDTIQLWFKRERILHRTPVDDHFMGLVRRMMTANPADRPTAELVEEEIALIGGLETTAGASKFCRPCCDHAVQVQQPQQPTPHPGSLPFRIETTIVVGNTYRLRSPKLHTYTFFVVPSIDDIVTEVHIFLHQSFQQSHIICEQPPYQFRGRGWGIFDISVYVVLKQGYSWDHPMARPIPRESGNRMLPLSWRLQFDSPRKSVAHAVAINSML